MPDIEVIRGHQQSFLDKEKARISPSTYTIEGIEVRVDPGVFPPATDTRLLASHIHVEPGQRTLDLTTGSGIFSIIAGLQGVTGVAVDINPAAVKNAAQNFEKHRVEMVAVESDLFQNVPEEKFDQIFANGPFFEGDILDPLDYACYGARKFIDGLLAGTNTHLKPDGKLLIVMSEWSDMTYFNEGIARNNLQSELSATRKSDDGERVYNLFEITIPKPR